MRALGRLVLGICALTAAGCAGAIPAPEIFDKEAGPPVPVRAQVSGVPFVSWNEAALHWYRDRDLANPSSHAAFLMVLGYWGQHWALTEDRHDMRRWGISEAASADGLDELKPLIAAGVPLIVPTGVTPYAHLLGPARRAAAAARGLALPDGNPRSGVLGDMVGLEAWRRLAGQLGTKRWESLLASFRVLVGYDDEHQVVTLHDPTFGPAWQLGYADFDRMWGVTDRAFILMQPHKPAEIVAARATAPPYRARTADEEAATHLVLAYALSAARRPSEAQAELLRGLAQPGLSPGYEHMLRLELTIHHLRNGQPDAAIREAERAADLAPEHHRVWSALAEAYHRQGRIDQAAVAEQRAEDLAACSPEAVGDGGEARTLPESVYLPAQRAVAALLARDFFIVHACPGSGVTWLLRALP